MIPEFIYLVMGEDGSDEQPVADWVVAAYPDKETAQLHAEHANRLVDEGNNLLPDELPHDEYSEREEAHEEWLESHSPFDPTYENGSVEARYYVMEVPFCLHPDAFMERFSK